MITRLSHPAFVLFLVLTAGLLGCNAAPAPATAVAQTTIKPAAATATEAPTSTPAPTNSPIATETLPPTETLDPTATSKPTGTSTPLPTATLALSPTASPTPSPSPPPPATATTAVTNLSIAELTALPDGQEVTAVARVVGTASFSGGYKFTLDDGSGRITLLMWHNVYDNCWDAPQLNLGAMVRATGQLGTFEGERQITPDFGGDVKVSAPGSPAAPERPIGELGNHLGERATITGQILRVEGNSAGATLFVGDDSGEIAVFIWQSTLDRIPNATLLGAPGTRVQITGMVQEYRSNRELVPVLPYDVIVLS